MLAPFSRARHVRIRTTFIVKEYSSPDKGVQVLIERPRGEASIFSRFTTAADALSLVLGAWGGNAHCPRTPRFRACGSQLLQVNYPPFRWFHAEQIEDQLRSDLRP